MDLTQAQWEYIEPYLPKDRTRRDGRGRPWSDRRGALEGILWILRTGARWKDLPERYGSYQTVHRRFQNWREAGVMERVLQALARDLKERAGIDVSECFIDATFVPAKRGALASGLPSGVKAQRSWWWQTLMVFLSAYARKALGLPK